MVFKMVSFSFLFESLNISVKGKEKKEKEAVEIKTNKESARTIQARRESEGGKLVI